jgi:hypothetical protein
MPPRTPKARASKACKVLPCLACDRGERAVLEVIGIYLLAMNGQLPPKLDGQLLPKTCCRRRAAVDLETLVA